MKDKFPIILLAVAFAVYLATKDLAVATLSASILGVLVMLFRILGLGERPIGGWLVLIPMTSLAIASLLYILEAGLMVSAIVFVGGFALFFYLLSRGANEIESER